MIQLDINGLIIQKSRDRAEEFSLHLSNRVFPAPFEVCHSCHGALELFCQTPFDICLISEEFSEDEVLPLFKDLHAIVTSTPCIFVKVTSATPLLQPPQVESSQLGFRAAISPALTLGDEEILRDSLTELIYREELKRRGQELGSAARLLLKEIDKNYLDLKRGRKVVAGRKGLRGFITQQVDFDQLLLLSYIQALDDYSSRAIPARGHRIQLPRPSNNQELPGVENGVYVGVSERVSEMLNEKFGGSSDGDTD